MKNINYLYIVLISVILASCSKVTDPVKNINLGVRSIDYQANDEVESLIIPPDLTSPRNEGLFKDTMEANQETYVSKEIQNIEVKRDKYRRWLLVDLPPNEVWALSKEFFRSYGFKIEKENQKIGLLETDFLEIETKVPDKSLGAIRAALSKALKTQYGLPIADKYRIRIESVDNRLKSEVYLTLSSIGEVVDGATRVWQPREKDIELETEMLLKLMVFLGNDPSDAITKIQSNTNEKNLDVMVVYNDSGYANLMLPFDRNESWKLLGWALDELSVDIDDRDQIGGNYFIKVIPNKGFFSKLLSTSSSSKTYQLTLREVGNNKTKIIFVDLNEDYDKKVINYSAELFNQIASKF